jgi:hypothetical protein
MCLDSNSYEKDAIMFKQYRPGSAAKTRKSAQVQKRARIFRPRLEQLEDRCLLSTFSVVNTDDSGPGSLRQAITSANGTVNVGGLPDRIEFNIPGAGVHTITPGATNGVSTDLGALPTIADPVVIDGYTQGLGTPDPADDAKPNTQAIGNDAVLLIELNGTRAGFNASGLTISADNSSVRGLVINRCPGSGIMLASSGNVVEGNFIGTDPSGNIDRHNGAVGVWALSGAGNLIGGTTPSARNLLSGNLQSGVRIDAPGTLVRGNYIGTNASGNVAISNVYGVAVTVGGHDALIGGADGDDSTIGAVDGVIGARNVISGNSEAGILCDTNGNGTLGAVTIQGNFIGVKAAGSAALANLGNGIVNDGRGRSDITIIGGSAPGAGNVISGNVGSGLVDFKPGTVVQGNFIGTDITGLIDLGNTANGIRSIFGTIKVGGLAAGEGNTIAYNHQAGVLGPHPLVLRNSIFANLGLGIDVGGDGVSPNDSEVGSNNAQNFPVLTDVTATATQTDIAGTLNSTPNSAFRLEFFASTTADTSGFGEGELFLGFTTAATGANGVVHFTAALETSVPTGQIVSATATPLDGNGNPTETSEFSAIFIAIAIELPPTDSPPIAVDDVLIVEQFASNGVNVLDNDFDPNNGDTIRLISVELSQVGATLEVSPGGEIVYVAPEDFL